MKPVALVIAALFSLAFTPLVAQDFEKGVAAYNSGDYSTAAREFTPLANQGDEVAQYNLGLMYYNGKGVPQDYAEAARLYRLAADQGYAKAQNNLAVMYEMGHGLKQDNVMAHMWYNLASANGSDKSAEWRDERAGLMTSADVSKAQAMARECMSSGYLKCGY